MGLQTVGESILLTLLSTPGTLFAPLGCLVQCPYESFCLVLSFDVVICGCFLLEACFLSEEEMDCEWICGIRKVGVARSNGGRRNFGCEVLKETILCFQKKK